MKNNTLWFILLGAVLALGIFVVWSMYSEQGEEGVMCTMEAKLCPDGSYVGRGGPRCEFAACPSGVSTEEEWTVSPAASGGVSFSYPKELGTSFIRPSEWPPTVTVTKGVFACKAEGSSLPNVQTVTRTIQGVRYCVRTESEGAAGSVYTKYTYSTEEGGKISTIEFVLRAPQCANYDTEKKTACTKEQQEFSPDSFVSRMMQSVSTM